MSGQKPSPLNKISNRFLVIGVSLILVLSIVPVIINWMTIMNVGGFDISLFAQVIYNVGHSFLPISTIAQSLHHMGTHFEPVVYLLGVIWRPLEGLGVSPSDFLMLSQLTTNIVTWVLLIRAIPKQEAQKNAQIIVPILLAVAHWGFLGPNSFEFHPVTLGLSLFLQSLVCFHFRKIPMSLVLLALATLCGEMWLLIGPVVATCFWLTSRERWTLKKSVVAQVIAFLASAIALGCYLHFKKFVFALDSKVTDFVSDRYSQLGRNVVELVTSPLRDPSLVLRVITEPDKISYTLLMLLPYLGIAGLAAWQFSTQRRERRSAEWASLFICGLLIAPAPFLKVLLSNYAPYLSVENHYAADILPALVIMSYALVLTLTASVNRALTILTAIGVLAGVTPFGSIFLKKASSYAAPRLHAREISRFLSDIDRNMAVYLDNNNLSPELCARRYFFGPLADGEIPLDHLPDVLVLTWPPEHFNHGVVVQQSMRASLRQLTPDTLESQYLGQHLVYKNVKRFPVESWGEVSVWQRQI